MNRRPLPRDSRPDRGSILPLTLIFVGAISMVVLALSAYVLSNLRYAGVTQLRSDRLSAADAGMRYAIDQLKLRNAGCILDTQEAVLPGVEADFNGATASVVCERITSGFEGIQAYAAVMTGEGLDPSDALLKSQSGSNSKVLGGPVYMSRIDPAAFDLGPPVKVENGPLLYHDDAGGAQCTSVKASTLPDEFVFEPELIFGPVCVSVPWQEMFSSPDVPDLVAGMTIRDGSASLAADPVTGSYTDVSGGGGCRVFEPGHYTTPPDTTGDDAYFKTGDYVMDFADEWEVRQAVVTAGRMNPLTTTTPEIPMTNACQNAQLSDPAPPEETGATFYFAGGAHLDIATQGSIEIHARQQGTDYVSVQTLCTPNGGWCRPGGDGGLGAVAASTLTAPGTSASDNLIYTDSGNNKEFVAHALVYAPLAQIEFGNVTNTATQRMRGGLIVSRLVLQSSASATNFEISVPTSPITAEILLTSTAVSDGLTSVQAVVQYRPYETTVDDRVRVNSWRVCSTASCDGTTTPPTPACSGSDPVWQESYWSNKDLAGAVDYTTTSPTLNHNWGLLPPDPSVTANGFSARFTRTVDLPAAGMYRFTVGSDDGQRFFVNGAQVLEDWSDQTYSVGTNTVDVMIDDPCSVDLVLEYYDNTGQARVSLDWVAL